jgi:hypothetical protein
MSALDLIVLLPLIPALLILVTLWWFPWDRWIPLEKIPKAFLGPYFLYAGFAAAYFKLGPWMPIALAVLGAALSIWAVVKKPKPEQVSPAKDRARPQGNGS